MPSRKTVPQKKKNVGSVPSQLELGSNLTKADLIALTNTVELAFKEAVKEVGGVEKEYVEVLKNISDILYELKLMVEFDHERRLRALEDYFAQ